MLGFVSFPEGCTNEIEDQDRSYRRNRDGEIGKRPGESAPLLPFDWLEHRSRSDRYSFFRLKLRLVSRLQFDIQCRFCEQNMFAPARAVGATIDLGKLGAQKEQLRGTENPEQQYTN